MNWIWILKFIVVIITMCIIDMCWGRYLNGVNEGNKLKAAFWAAVLPICNCLLIVGYIEDKRFVGGAIIGAFIGTYITVKKKKDA